jgi:hypothetical protein
MRSVATASLGWRPATTADCISRFLKDMIAEDSTYQPYDVVTDLSNDALPDHAFVLIKGDSGRIYWVLALDDGYDTPQLLGEVNWIREGGLVVRDHALMFGKFYSDVASTWQWSATSRRLELVPQESGEN